MKNLTLFLFLLVTSISIVDGADPTKVVVIVNYDNGANDKLVLDKNKLTDDNVVNSIDNFIELRTK